MKVVEYIVGFVNGVENLYIEIWVIFYFRRCSRLLLWILIILFLIDLVLVKIIWIKLVFVFRVFKILGFIIRFKIMY